VKRRIVVLTVAAVMAAVMVGASAFPALGQETKEDKCADIVAKLQEKAAEGPEKLAEASPDLLEDAAESCPPDVVAGLQNFVAEVTANGTVAY
jgi:hypothetical protein